MLHKGPDMHYGVKLSIIGSYGVSNDTFHNNQ